jgi:hypothetical protein
MDASFGDGFPESGAAGIHAEAGHVEAGVKDARADAPATGSLADAGGSLFEPLESLGSLSPNLYYALYQSSIYSVYDSGYILPLAGGAPQAATFNGPWGDLRSDGETVVIGSKLYLIGGGGEGVFDQWEVDEWDYVDLAAETYSVGGTSPAYAHQLAAAAYQTSIYAIGGNLQEHGSLGSTGVSVLDTTTGSWSTGTPLPVPRAQHGAAVLGTTLLVAGGVCSGGGACAGPTPSSDFLLDSSVTLDLSSPAATWQPGPTLPAGIEKLTIVACGSRFYGMGGTTLDDSALNWTKVLSWAPGEASWRVEGTIPSGIYDLTILTTATQIYLLDFTHAQVDLWTP